MKFTFVPEASPLEGYTIKRAIHRGGFGEVYYALSDSGKEVALKLLNHNLEVELRGVSQCLNLKHQNLVTIFDIREDRDGDHWIVMEYIGGRGLFDELQRDPSGLPIEETLQWLSGITAGLSFLHDSGIVHRDLKPANVFRDQDTVKIGDVGLSKYISESRRSAQTQSVGTVYYMAPEVCRGHYGREVDIYALGIMLVEMLTGQVPFDGETTAEILMKHMTAEPDLSAVPEQLREVISHALEKDPDQRIQDAEELERRFRDAANAMDPLDFSIPSRKQPAGKGSPGPEKARRPKPIAEADLPKQSGHGPEKMAAVAEYWNKLPVLLKWVVGGVLVVGVLETGLVRYLTSGASLGISVYLGYLLASRLFGSKTPGPSSAAPVSQAQQPVAVAQESETVSISPVRKHDQGYPHFVVQEGQRYQRGRKLRGKEVHLNPATPRVISKRHRFTDLTNSLSISLTATFLVTLAVYMTTSLLPRVVHAVYFGSVTMAGAWALLILCKLREGRIGDVMMRRLLQGTLGLGIGFLAAGLQHYLMLSGDLLFEAPKSIGGSWVMGRVQMADGTGDPTMAAFMSFFGVLFAARRWWWQTDSFRTSRFRISSTLFTLLVGTVVAGILHFPGTLGATWALAISAVVQLSAGWTPQEERLLQQETPEAKALTGIAANMQSGKQTPAASG